MHNRPNHCIVLRLHALWLLAIASGCATVSFSAVHAQTAPSTSAAKPERGHDTQQVYCNPPIVPVTPSCRSHTTVMQPAVDCESSADARARFESLSKRFDALERAAKPDEPSKVIGEMSQALERCGQALTARFEFEKQWKPAADISDSSFQVLMVLLGSIGATWLVLSTLGAMARNYFEIDLARVKALSAMRDDHVRAEILTKHNAELSRLLSQCCCRDCKCNTEDSAPNPEFGTTE